MKVRAEFTQKLFWHYFTCKAFVYGMLRHGPANIARIYHHYNALNAALARRIKEPCSAIWKENMKNTNRSCRCACTQARPSESICMLNTQTTRSFVCRNFHTRKRTARCRRHVGRMIKLYIMCARVAAALCIKCRFSAVHDIAVAACSISVIRRILADKPSFIIICHVSCTASESFYYEYS